MPEQWTQMLAGFGVGWSEVLVGYPFWTCKTLVQNQEFRPRTLTLRRLYRGVRYPCVSSVAFNTVAFPCKEYLHNAHHMSYWTAGALAGLVVTPQTFVMDTFTIRSQVGQKVRTHLHALRGARGLGMTAVRESSALSVYFGVYHALRDRNVHVAAAGATAGALNWALTLPFDTLRTRQIAQRCHLRAALAQGHLWAGFRFALARAMIVNACSFTVYETACTYFG